MAAFTPGNIVIYRVGDGTAALTSSATAVFLDEYSPSGTLIQSIALPTADNGANQTLTASGTAGSEGLLTRSADGQYLILTGYDAAVGTAAVNGTTTTGGTPIVRVVGRVTPSGTIDTTTTTTSFSASNVRSATSADGSGFWVTGANTGVVYQPFAASGAGTIVSTTVTNDRDVLAAGGNLYFSTGSGTTRGVYQVGTGLPTATGTTSISIASTGSTTSPYQIFFADLTAAVAGVDTLYIVDDGGSTGGLYKFSLVGGAWTANGSVVSGGLAGRGLTGSAAGSTVTLFETTTTNTLIRLTDSGGYNAALSLSAPTVLATAATNTVFRGVALAPQNFIPGGTQTVTYTIGEAGTFTLAAGVTRTQTTGVGVTVSNGVGAAIIVIEGTLNDTATNQQRAINIGTGNGGSSVSIAATGSVQSLAADAIRSQTTTGTVNLTNMGQILVNANGVTPAPGGPDPNNAHAVNWNAALGTSALATDYTSGGTITNGSSSNATASIVNNFFGDAVRLGSHMTLVNYGTINAAGAVNDTQATGTNFYSTARGVRLDTANTTAVQIINFGSIAGSQHGIDTNSGASNIVIVNNAGATITGRNGSGIGSDSVQANPASFTITNSGTITGAYAGSGNIIDRGGNQTVDGDGDGIDIDGAATINNLAGGTIQGTGKGGFDTGGRANNSEGISLGGGVINNQGVIRGADFGIIINNDSNTDGSRSGIAATTVSNFAGGTITGQAGYAIRFENKTGSAADNDRITNYGTITGNGTVPTGTVTLQGGAADPRTVGTLDGVTYSAADAGSARFIRGDGAAIQTGEGDDVLDNYGTITGNSGRAISLEGGGDIIVLNTGSSVTGRIDGGSGTDSLYLRIDTRVAGDARSGANSGLTNGSLSNVVNFEELGIINGNWSLLDAQSYQWTFVQSAGTLTLAAAGSLGAVTLYGNLVLNASAGTGTITFTDGAQALSIANAALGTDAAKTLANTLASVGTDGDRIVFTDIAATDTAASYDGTAGTLTLTNRMTNAVLATVNVGTGLGAAGIVTSDTGAGGTSVSFTAAGSPASGTAGADVVTGTAAADTFFLDQGGDDRVSTGDGNDGVFFAGAYSAGDSVDGGAGVDQVGLRGTYTATLNNLVNTEYLAVLSGTSTRYGGDGTARYVYDLTTVDATVAAGVAYVVQANELVTGENLRFNGAAETNGSFRVFAGAGIDTLTGGAGDDGFFFGEGGRFTAADTVDGGAGNDQIGLRGNYAVTLSATTVVNVEGIVLLSASDAGAAAEAGAYTYNLVLNDATTGAGQSLTVNAAQLRTAESATINGSAETASALRLIGGAGNDTLIGGGGADILFGGGGADTLTGGNGNDIFRYNSVANSAPGAADAITDLRVGDLIDLELIDAVSGGGDDAFTFIGSAAFSGVAGQLRVTLVSAGNYLVEGDIDGVGGADFAINVASDHAIVATDFIL